MDLKRKFNDRLVYKEQYMSIILNLEKRTFIFISESRKKWPLFCKGQCIFLLHVPFCTPLWTSATLAMWTHWALWGAWVSETQLWNIFLWYQKVPPEPKQIALREIFSMLSWLTGYLCCVACCAGGHYQDGTPKCVLVRFRRVQQRCAPLLPR